MKLKLTKYHKEQLNVTNKCIIEIPIIPSTCTVNNTDVTERSHLWNGLAWTDVRLDNDGNPCLVHLTVNFIDESAKEERRYRVRSRYDYGDTVSPLDYSDLFVGKVAVAGYWDGQWWWGITLRRDDPIPIRCGIDEIDNI